MDLGVPPFQETPIFQQDSDPGAILFREPRLFWNPPQAGLWGSNKVHILVLDESLHYTAYYHTYIMIYYALFQYIPNIS